MKQIVFGKDIGTARQGLSVKLSLAFGGTASPFITYTSYNQDSEAFLRDHFANASEALADYPFHDRLYPLQPLSSQPLPHYRHADLHRDHQTTTVHIPSSRPGRI